LKLTPGGVFGYILGCIFGKPCFQRPDLLNERFIIMLPDVEFNSEQNGVTVKMNNENVKIVPN
jgi:hypothetical protein